MSPSRFPEQSGRQTQAAALFGLALLLGLALLSGCGAGPPVLETDAPTDYPAVSTATATPHQGRPGPYPSSAVVVRQSPDAGTDSRRPSGSVGPSSSPVAQSPTSVPPRSGTYTSRLLVDPEANQLLVSHSAGDDGFRTSIATATPTPRPGVLVVFDGETGHRVRTIDLAPGERLFAVDVERRRALLHDRQRSVRWLHLDTLEPADSLSLPTPDPMTVGPREYYPGFVAEPSEPALDLSTGQVAVTHGQTVHFYDPNDGPGRPPLELPVSGNDIVTHVAISESGRWLYAGVVNPDARDWIDRPGTTLLGIDLRTREVVDEVVLNASVWSWLAWGWLAWGESLVVTTAVHKDLGYQHSAWQAGRERARVFDSKVVWLAGSSDHGLAFGAFTNSKYYGAPTWLMAAPPATLQYSGMGQEGTRLGLRTQERVSRMAYDDESDQLYILRPDRATLSHYETDWAVSDPQSVFTGLPAPMEPSPTPDPALNVIPHAGPASFAGLLTRASPAPLTPGQVAAWRRPFPEDSTPRFDCVVPSPAFDTDGTVFACTEGLGIFRSFDAGRTWRHTSAGIAGRWIREVVVSPNFPEDRTVVASVLPGIQYTAAFADRDGDESGAFDSVRSGLVTAWVSRDAGDSWAPLGRLSALAFSPNFAADERLYAFGHMGDRFYESGDAGRTWEPVGRLPRLLYSEFAGTSTWVVPATDAGPETLVAAAGAERCMGGGPQWPMCGSRVFASQDDGRTWDLAWDPVTNLGQPGVNSAVGAMQLLGPLALTQPISGPHWFLHLDGPGNQTLISGSNGRVWRESYLPDHIEAEPVAVLESGRVLMSEVRQEAGFRRPHVFTAEPEAFVWGTPTPGAPTETR